MSMFEQRHYNAIADALCQVRPENIHESWGESEAENCKQEIVDALVKLFEQDNPKFQESLFRVACEE